MPTTYVDDLDTIHNPVVGARAPATWGDGVNENFREVAKFGAFPPSGGHLTHEDRANVLLGGWDGTHSIGTGARNDYENQILATTDGTNLFRGNIVAGGGDNTIFEGTVNAIVGGAHHRISEAGMGWHNTILGGSGSQITGTTRRTDYAVLAGGSANKIDGGEFASIIGGQNQVVELSNYVSLAGGRDHIIGSIANGVGGQFGFVGGGQTHQMGITSSAADSTILGGARHEINAIRAGILAGEENEIGAQGLQAAIVGGDKNLIGFGTTTTAKSVICGGIDNQVGTVAATAAVIESGILAGARNVVDALRSGIVAGADNTVSPGATNTVILGGTNITATEANSVYLRQIVMVGQWSEAAAPTNGLYVDAGGFVKQK